MKPPLFILVLAAGKGTRMKSEQPKALHTVAGRSLLEHVLATASVLKPKEICVVLGSGRAEVKQALLGRGWKKLAFAVQDQQLGSGHAVLQARSWLRNKRGTVLVVYGDTPLLTAASLQRLLDHHAAAGHGATFLAMDLPNPAAYGRVVMDRHGLVERIVEAKDATEDEQKIRLVNSGVVGFDVGKLLSVLPKLRPNNAKREYYLTDTAALLREAGHGVGVVTTDDPSETHGVNDRAELACAESLWRKRVNERWMLEGVTMTDPSTTYIDMQAELAPDVRLGPGVIIQGASRIGVGCEIGAYTVIEDSIVKAGAKVGPFAHLRPGSVIEEGAHIGNFVETKKTRVGKGSKANHLTYLGDTEIGCGANIGAGTITCNYDGFSKHKTVIEDGVFVGSNANLVAPVRVGKGAIVGAGSTITENVPGNSLVIARSAQVAKKGWAERFRRKQKRGKL